MSSPSKRRARVIRFVILTFGALSMLFMFAPLAGGQAMAAGPAQVSSTATLAHLTAYASFQGDPITAPRSNGTPETGSGAPQVIPFRGPAVQESLAPSLEAEAPSVEASPVIGNAPSSLLANFNGISDKKSTALAGGEITPPDQGLCAGLDSSLKKVIYEPVNIAVGKYSAAGALLGAKSVRNFFGDSNAFSDPRCFYDASTKAWFFTIISWAGGTSDTFTDILVVNSSGAGAGYHINTSFGSTCFGDQPHVGYDKDNLYISHDEFCGFNFATYSGADLWAISKSQLVAESNLVNACHFGKQSLGGVPVLTMEPAVSPGASTEYLLNSFPWLANGAPNPSSTLLGLWEVDGGSNVTAGNCGMVTLTGNTITSEKYVYPLPAKSTGTGKCNKISGIWVCSENKINPDDDRMLQVEEIVLGGKPTLWGALTSAVKPAGDTTTRDGIAWFKIDPVGEKVLAQGFLATIGNYLIYPAIFATSHGTTTMVFTATSPSRNPSAAYSVMGTTKFGSIIIASSGTSAHKSFATPLNGSQYRYRWGDYSAAALDPNGHDVWMATEYIPPLTSQDPFDNWGTRVIRLLGK